MSIRQSLSSFRPSVRVCLPVCQVRELWWYSKTHRNKCGTIGELIHLSKSQIKDPNKCSSHPINFEGTHAPERTRLVEHNSNRNVSTVRICDKIKLNYDYFKVGYKLPKRPNTNLYLWPKPLKIDSKLLQFFATASKRRKSAFWLSAMAQNYRQCHVIVLVSYNMI